MSRSNRKLKVFEKPKLKLDFGCGNIPAEGFTGVDIIKFDKVAKVVDLRKKPWPWMDNSVEEARASHFVEHLTALERVIFCNELYRILVPGGQCQVITPHWASCRAYGDFTHVWPPVSEFWFHYLNKSWRETQAPHTDIKYNPDGLNCDFEITWGYALREDVLVKNQELQQMMIQNYKEVCQDTWANFKKV